MYHRKCIYILLLLKFARIENEMVGAWTHGWRNCCRSFSFNQFVWFNQWVKSILLWFLSSLKPCRWPPSVFSFASMNCSRGGRGALFGVRTGTVPCGRWLTLLCSEAPGKDTWGSLGGGWSPASSPCKKENGTEGSRLTSSFLSLNPCEETKTDLQQL